jgi:ABC-type bacteriocin/lantibiotic exporter with double-glycine peptidase domain
MIEFRNVSFAYEKGKEVLHDMSFRIEKGESVGLIGANGAGKSTIMKLLLGLLQGEGKVLADAFGIVAMVAMTPLITIQLLGFRAVVHKMVRDRIAMKRILSADDKQIIRFM